MEYLVVLLALIYSSGAVLPLLTTGRFDASAAGADNRLLEGVLLAIYAVVALVMLRNWRALSSADVPRRHLPLAAILALAFLSCFWSAAPALTIRRALTLSETTILGVYLVQRYDREQVLRIVSTVLACLSLGSLVFVLFLPRYGLDALHDNAWRGLFTERNSLGRVAALSVPVSALAFLSLRRGRVLNLINVAVSGALLLRSQSGTALALVCSITILGLVAYQLRRGLMSAGLTIIGIVVAAAPFVFFAVNRPQAIFEALGRDDTLTGRTLLWSVVWQMIGRHWLLGYGYGAFWRGFNGPSATVLALFPFASQAHNGFLNVWLDLGVVGVVAVSLYALVSLLRAMATISPAAGPATTLPFVLVSFSIAANLTESTFLSWSSLFWALFVVGASLAVTGVEQTEPAPAPHATSGTETPHGRRATVAEQPWERVTQAGSKP